VPNGPPARALGPFREAARLGDPEGMACAPVPVPTGPVLAGEATVVFSVPIELITGREYARATNHGGAVPLTTKAKKEAAL